MQISIIADNMVTEDKKGYLGEVSGHVTIKNLDMFAKICLKYHICCGLFFNRKRNYENFREIWFLQFDFDDGTPLEEVTSKIIGYNLVIMGSKNHMKDKDDGKGVIPRFHAFIPLSKPIVDSEYYHFLIKEMAKVWNFKIDVQSTDATRYMHKHSYALYKRDMAMNFDPLESQYVFKFDSIKRAEEKENDRKLERLKTENQKFKISFEERMSAAKEMIKKFVGQSVEGMDGDKTTFVAMCYGVKCGLSDDMLINFAHWYNDQYCKPKWTIKALQHKIKCAKKKVKSGDVYPPTYLNKILGKEDLMKLFI